MSGSSSDSRGQRPSHQPTAVDIAHTVTDRFGPQLRVYREVLDNVARTRKYSNLDEVRWPRATYAVRGPAEAAPGTVVEVTHTFQDADDLGSFPLGAAHACIRIHVHGFRKSPESQRSATRDRVLLPRNESEGWARAVLGVNWSDYAYELIGHGQRAGTSPLQTVYVVFVDDECRPLLAPDNLSFSRLWMGRFEPRKLLPDSSNRSLNKQIIDHGPFAETESIRDPRTDPDGGWSIEISGDDPDSLNRTAREAFDYFCQAVRIRGAVSSRFRTERVELDGHHVKVVFQWNQNPNLFALSMRLPFDNKDFRGPPMDTPKAVVSTVLMNWSEELATGWLVRGIRRREGGVIHVSAPEQKSATESSDYFVSSVPLHDHSGVWLKADGLRIVEAVNAKEAGTLAVWLQAYENNRQGYPYVGHAAARWTAPGSALFEVLETANAIPDSVTRKLIRATTHTLANVGALTIDTTFDHAELAELGYRQVSADAWRLDVRTMP